MRISTDQIDADALPRDRSALSGPALDELMASIAASGLRQPVEVYETATGYALISGYRRLAAIRALHAMTGDARYGAIEATLRTPATRAAAMAAMVEENEIRETLSPWDRGAVAVTARDVGVFDTLDAAIAGLFPHASRQKRARLRLLAEVAEALAGAFAEPERISENRLLRIGACLRLGWEELIVTALTEPPLGKGESEWKRIAPVIGEAEALPGDARNPSRPRRLCTPRPGLTIRRERTRHGYVLHITGRQASSALVAEVLDNIEAMFTTR